MEEIVLNIFLVTLAYTGFGIFLLYLTLFDDDLVIKISPVSFILTWPVHLLALIIIGIIRCYVMVVKEFRRCGDDTRR